MKNKHIKVQLAHTNYMIHKNLHTIAKKLNREYLEYLLEKNPTQYHQIWKDVDEAIRDNEETYHELQDSIKWNI